MTFLHAIIAVLFYCRAHEYLSQAEKLYHDYNALNDEAPYTLSDHFSLEQMDEVQRRKNFENLHTYTLFYLAQVYKSLSRFDF